MKHVAYWMDNCASQNKNWCLYSSMAALVNSSNVAIQDITFTYLEKRHTFMSADSIHHGVEKQIAQVPGTNMYHFRDFVNVVNNSNFGCMNAVELKHEDVRAFQSGVSSESLGQLHWKTYPYPNAVFQRDF